MNADLAPSSNSQEAQWNTYWEKQNASGRLYGRIASFYRRVIIAPSVKRAIKQRLGNGTCVLHVGAGSGEIDALLPNSWSLFSIDFSSAAIGKNRRLQRSIGRTAIAVQADMFTLPFATSRFDVVFNLGVMEHFSDDEVVDSLLEMNRVLAPSGHIIMYWPPVWGPTVIVLHLVAAALRLARKSKAQLHPPEINLFRSRRRCRQLLSRAGLQSVSFSYGPHDLFTHVVIVANRVP